VAAIVALILAMVVPLFFLMRTQKQGDEQEEKNKTAELAREIAKNAKKEAKLERGTGKKKKKGGIEAMKAASKAGGAGGADDDDDEGGGAKSGAQAKRAEREAANDEDRRAAADERDAPREGETPKDAAKRIKEEAREARQAAREEAARVAKEEEDRRKQEEYDKWKDMFSVDDAGEEVGAEAEDEGLLQRFVTYIKQQKVAVLEDLASEFGLKVVDVISRVQALEQMGYISGVVDDRGKFIYIERGEMEAMAQFIKKKGRVRISALAQESSRLIDLEPKVITVDDTEEVPVEDTATGFDAR
jgi:hypothetical protein